MSAKDWPQPDMTDSHLHGFEQAVGRTLDAELPVDPDQLSVKGCMMEFR
jgi:hypothetical protein